MATCLLYGSDLIWVMTELREKIQHILRSSHKTREWKEKWYQVDITISVWIHSLKQR